MTRTRRRFPVCSLLAAGSIALGSCRGGCHRTEERAASVEGRLALFPAATRVVASLDGAKLRASPAAAKLATLAGQSDSDQRIIDEFGHRTGFDPSADLSSVTLAFPDDARTRGELGMLVRAEHMDETRLVAYVRDELQKKGDDLVATIHGRFTLWSPRSDPQIAGFFIDPHTFALGGGGWGPRMADLAESARPEDSAATDLELTRLVERAAAAHAIWAVALVPEAIRRSLGADPASAAAAGVLTLSAGIDIGKGLDLILLADLATAADAHALIGRATEALREAKRNPQVLLAGLGPYLDGVAVREADRTFELRGRLDEPAFDDLLARLKGLAALARSGQVPGFGTR